MSERPPVWPDCVPHLVDTDTGVVLRAHTDADIPALVEQCRDPETVRWTTVPDPYAEHDARWFIHEKVAEGWRTGTESGWAIEAEVDGVRRFCGQVDIRHPDGPSGEIGFAVHPAARGRGVMVSAARLALDWAFDVRGLQVVRWAALVGNWPSRHVAAALGFRDEGVRRRDRIHRGELRDHWSASLLPSDPRTSVAAPRQPDLAGDRLRLRHLAERDLPRIVEACRDPEVSRWLSSVPSPYAEADALAYLEDAREEAFAGTRWTWAVTDEADLLLGSISLFRLRHDARQAEIGYWAHPDVRGRGLTAEATRIVAQHALGEGAQESLIIRCAPENTASRRVALAAGFVETGVVPRAQRLRDGAYADLVVYARLR